MQPQPLIPISISGLTATQLIQLETCVKCGACAHACPVYNEDKHSFAIPALKLSELRDIVNRANSILSILFPRRMLVARGKLEKIAKEAYGRCTLCGRCWVGCVFNIDNRELREVLRSTLYRANLLPEPLMKFASALREARNPLGLEAKRRLNWVNKLKEVKVGEEASTVYFVGCQSSLTEDGEGIATATATLLSLSREDWAILGEQEWCCGNPWIAIGDFEQARRHALHNTLAIEALRAKRVITSCACCYQLLKWKYPQLIGRQPRFEVLHTSEYLSQRTSIIPHGNPVPLYKRLDVRATYHDPCLLARLGGVVEEPRRIIRGLVKEFIEMPENRIDTYCCGGGGLLKELERDLSVKIGIRRIKHAESVKAELLLTACPFCKANLAEAAAKAGSSIRVLDLAELVARQAGLT
ncbi:MAG: (Fe-S)-binding protein [Candidatus Nezhaarchaeales archaeon]